MSRGEVVFTTAAVTGIVCVAAAAICVWVAVTDPAGLLSGASAGGATSVASLVVRADPRDTDWHVTLDARDLPREGEPVIVRLANWGEWTEADSYHLRWLESDPPLARMEGRRDAWTIVRPPDWNGALHVEYAIGTTEAGSSAHAAHGLLPYRGPAYTFGFSTNTLIEISGASTRETRLVGFREAADVGAA